MRGKLILIPCVQPRGRITPADAGKTAMGDNKRMTQRDHPRGCGENATLRRPIGATRGSPPRMRGKLPSISSGNDLTRITPADAGKTARDVFRGSGCGGSPPRMRGKRKEVLRGSEEAGITPADAGKTPPEAQDCAMLRDHPRGCGENISKAVGFGGERGSPPRMRGKHQAEGVYAVPRWITPADAGKTL